MSRVALNPSRCAICNTKDNATELYPPNIDPDAFNSEIFSARRLPDRIHYRVVKCNACGLVRSYPVAEPEALAGLYEHSTFNYAGEVEGLRRTYSRHLSKLDALGVKKNALLEIGCGNGFFLEEAMKQGYKTVRGVEPSSQAISMADQRIRPLIVCDVMKPGLFTSRLFDVICMFQVFDHISDPNALLSECHNLLKPGGLLLILNHNVEALSARVFGKLSPIIDIEHTYLYSAKTISQLTEQNGFKTRAGGPVWNDYTLKYLSRLLPLPDSCKRALLVFLNTTHLGRLRLKMPIGNLWIAIQKASHPYE